MSGLIQPQRVVEMIVVVPPRLLLLDLAGPMEVLRKANLEQDNVRFTVRYVGPSATINSSIGLGLAGIEPLPDAIADGVMIIVLGNAAQPLGAVDAKPEPDDILQEATIVAWLRSVVRPGVKIVTICAGALLAARAGLLEGYTCTTHYSEIAELRQLAPTAKVLENRLYIEDRDRLSSAGITAGIDMMLALVAEEAGHTIALNVARYLVVYLRRAGNDPQLSPWLEGRNHIHPVIHKVQDAVSADPAGNWTVASMAAVAATSARSLSRLFNEQTGMSVTDYVNRLRIALAHELVTASRLDMEMVAERAGFASTRHMRRTWKKLYGGTPTALRNT
ncbi:helix-turn-helix domain-containing protein [Agrobacterium vitis]|uniref:Helix-turn-helix domain-containing protein n=1 Tax=Agrobacterium vitis TaxID=373 RepID=A0AAE4W9M1_AGRVI|nr:helix-turn-helix domain-containing protein [Agrobacterium vitis]MCF1498649.1 helix-turn-helix domain-containing protein [Allorhizobium sp. Av2]MCM2438233.1 helix-turn-helix domain-containing protein [Agrobacterium vitis]MUZ56386.1 helix-turn-helix domain-containing protein [Agrobacterium vitis]MVA64477.1 helix-turn-helix domain-containing protein [Agrobacterium vitis]MVA85448.1 helix-turn-helix domain-containing protein [Agrobacterium vitis]